MEWKDLGSGEWQQMGKMVVSKLLLQQRACIANRAKWLCCVILILSSKKLEGRKKLRKYSHESLNGLLLEHLSRCFCWWWNTCAGYFVDDGTLVQVFMLVMEHLSRFYAAANWNYNSKFLHEVVGEVKNLHSAPSKGKQLDWEGFYLSFIG